jgi:hypothetical protein
MEMWPILLLACSTAAKTGAICDVRDHGAQGGGADDTTPLQAVLDDPGCDEILIPAGHSFAASALFVRRSHVTLTIESNATLAGLPSVFVHDRPECGTEAGLEFNWSNWCALLRVQSATNFTLRGAGTLEPGGVGGATPNFYSALHVRSTSGVFLGAGLRIHCTAWWWCTALHNASYVAISKLFVDGLNGRDGMDLVNCRHVRIEDSRVEGSDDALCFKTISNDGLVHFPSHNVTVVRSTIASQWCNAIQFGSATEVNMSDFSFVDVRITMARKAAIGILSMDGAHISDIHFTDVTIDGSEIATPLYVKMGNRVLCEDGKGTCWRPGSISGISLTRVTALRWGNVSNPKPHHGTRYTPTIEGLNASYTVGPISIDQLQLVAPGGGTAADAAVDPPISPLVYQPRYDGRGPSYALFARYATDVTISNSSMRVAAGATDGRPAIVADDLSGLVISNVDAGGGGAASHCQLETRNSSGDWRDHGKVVACAWTPTAPSRSERASHPDVLASGAMATS